MNGEARLDYIDGLRAVAIGLVVCFHAHLPGVPSGYVGVDIFFVISGFLISGQIFDGVRNGSFSMADFYARRILRLGPPLLLVISAVLIADCILPILPVDMKQIALSAIPSAAMVSNWYFWGTADYFAIDAERQPLLHLWSLGVEEQYYLVAPATALGLVILARRMRIEIVLLWLGGAAGVLACSLAAAVVLAAKKPDLVFFATPLRAWEFASGALVCLLLRRGVVLSRSLARVGALAGLAAIGWASAVSAFKPEYRIYVELLAVLGAGSVLFCGEFTKGGIACRLLVTRPMVGLGLISYSLYLWHWPVLAFVRLTHLDPPTPLENLLAGVVGPILLAVLTHLTVERPIRAWRQGGGLATARVRIIAQGIGASMLIGTIGLAVVIAAAKLNNADRFRAYGEAAARVMEKCNAGARDAGPSIECRLGAGSDARVLLWGDSHALSVAPAVDVSAIAARLSAYLQWDGGCPPLPGNTLYDVDEIWTYCMRRNERVLRWLDAPDMQSVTGVVLAGAWQRHYGHVASIADVDDADTSAKLRKALIRTIGELHGIGLRVLVLGPVPDMPYPAPECVFRAQSGGDIRRCGYMRSDVDRMQHNIVEALRSASSQFDDTRYVDPKAAFCDSDFCWPARGGNIFYSDTNHLSVSGARVLHDRFKDEFDWAFAAQKRAKPLETAR